MEKFKQYRFRASQSFYLDVGTIGVTENQDQEISDLLYEKEHGINANGNKVKFTDKKAEKLATLQTKKSNKELPKTMKTELRKIHRAEKFNRNFLFTNKFVQKGLSEEEEAITTYINYRKKVLGIRTHFSKNDLRLFNDFFQGEPDINPFLDNELKKGADTKCSWSLDSFPYPEDTLDNRYECQNQVYMDLTGADVWETVYVLVNASEDLIHKEKQKWFYALQMPGEVEHKYYKEYVQKCKEIEKMMIFDYDRFVEINPSHIMEYSRSEWFAEGNDIPLKNRVCIKTSIKDEDKIQKLRDRATIARKYLLSLEEQTL